MTKRFLPTIIVCLMLLPITAPAQDTVLSSEQEERAQALFATLHCVVCEGQSLAGSDARIAHNLRALVRQKIRDGESDEAITAYLVERYGEEILMAPPVTAKNLPVWLAPLIIMIIGAIAAWRILFTTQQPTSSR